MQWLRTAESGGLGPFDSENDPEERYDGSSQLGFQYPYSKSRSILYSVL